MKHILKVAIIFAIIFNCTISPTILYMPNALTYLAGMLLLRTPGVPPQALNTEYAKSADTNPL